MIVLKEQEYTINICIDIIEWAKELYGMPEDAELINPLGLSRDCMGFAQIDEKIIWVFIPKKYRLKDLKSVIAHEVGHIIEMKYPANPDETEEAAELHEMKADYYMDFYLLVDKIVADVVGQLAAN